MVHYGKKIHLNGISSSVVMDDEYTIHFHYNQLGFWQSNKDQSVEIDCYCSQIYNAFINKIFGSFKEYQNIFEKFDYRFSITGLDAESSLNLFWVYSPLLAA